jgi:uncharacterized protein
MFRCYTVSKEVLKFLNESEQLDMKRTFSITWERIHSLGTAHSASMLAAKRGIDIAKAYTAGALHDIGRIVTGEEEDHGINGYEPAKEFLTKMDMFNEQEIEEIALAVKNHSNKATVGMPLEEVVKDGDVLDCFLLELPLRKEAHKNRFAGLQRELGLTKKLEIYTTA